MKNNKKKLAAVIIAAVLIVLLALVYVLNRPAAARGTKSVTIEVVDNAGTTASYETATDAEYLAEVFEEIPDLTVEGDQSDYGLYITTVNGLTADYDADGAYWAIYVNGEYGNYGADQQPVTDGDVYTLEYTVYAE